MCVLAAILLCITQSNFLRCVITSENKLKGKIKMEWNDWPLSICVKHLWITISHIKPSLMMKVAVMSDVVNTPSHCWVNEHWKRTFELMVNDKFSWLKQFMNLVLISLAPFLLAVWAEVERIFCGSAGSAGPGFALGCFWLLWGALSPHLQCSQERANGSYFPDSPPPFLLSSVRSPVLSESTRSVVLCFVEFNKYSQLKKWLQIERWGISQTFSICNLLIWVKLIVIVLILITALLFLHFIPSSSAFIYMYEEANKGQL